MEKEVKNLKAGYVLLDIVNSLKQGKSIQTIRQELNISKQLLSYYLRRLKETNQIKKIGYGVWEVTSQTSSKVAEIRGHAFMWKVKTNLKINWLKDLDNKKRKLIRDIRELEEKKIKLQININKLLERERGLS